MHDTTSPPARRDLERELRAVTSALDTATARRASIERDIGRTRDIERLGTLHDQWAQASEDLAAARERMAELHDLLDL